MLFLIRSAFWLAVIVMLLPSDPREQARFYETASAAVHRAATFCDRNASVCAEAEAHWGVFRQKLAVGAVMARDLISEQLSGRPDVAAGGNPPVRRLEGPLSTRDTLSSGDRNPPWRGMTPARM